MSLLGPLFEAQVFGGLLAAEVDDCEDDLAEFVIRAWPVIDPGNALVWGAPMDAICDHLAAVDNGNITRLLISVPPGFSKSTITNIMLPAWMWLRRPHLRFICASYSEKLTQRDNDRCRRIIASEWYQAHWGQRFHLVPPNRPDKFENNLTGWKLATSVGGQLLGQRGDLIILDDPNSPQVESEQVRATTNRWFTETVPTRLNDMERSAIIVIQQRMHLEDIIGTALGQSTSWVHLNLPMEYEPRVYMNGYRAGSERIESFFDDDAKDCAEVFWADWRTEPGELAWPERFPRLVVEDMKAALGPTASASQLQQWPVPRGGAIIKAEWWQRWPEEPFPPMTYIVASLDTAYTAKKHNDPSACTVWGCAPDENHNPRVFLLWAWQEHLQLHDLVTKIIDTCTVDQRVGITGPRFPCHRVLIEDAASGQSVAQELYRLLGEVGKFGIDVIPPRQYGDKTARLYSVEHVFAQKIVYAHDRAWADKVIQQCASVPFCPTLEQRVLTADLQWIAAGDLRPGEKLLGFDERPRREDGLRKRLYRQSFVQQNVPIRLRVIRLEMNDGSCIRAAVTHPWLTTRLPSRNQMWMTCEEIMAAFERGFSVPVNRFIAPWIYPNSRAAGWLSGIYDGEGYLVLGKGKYLNANLGVTQNPGLVQSEILRQLSALGFQVSIFDKNDGRENNKALNTLVLGGWPERLRLLGSVRPLRLLEKFMEWFDQGGSWQMECWEKPLRVVNCYDEGEQWCAGLQTSSQTYVCEGFAAHNTRDDHLADSTAQAIRWLRERGFAPTADEVRQQAAQETAYRPKMKALYPV